MFQGSKNAQGEYFDYAEKAGANIAEGGVNGTTSQDRTNYFVTAPSANLEHLLWLEADRLATLLDTTTQEKLDKQRKVVKNERRQGLENQPYGRWLPLMYGRRIRTGTRTMAGDRQPGGLFRRDTRGREGVLPGRTTRRAICRSSSPATSTRRRRSAWSRSISAISRPGRSLDRPARWVQSLTTEKIVEVSDRISLERVYMGWPTPAYFSQTTPRSTSPPASSPTASRRV